MIKKLKNLTYGILIKTQKFTGTDNIYLFKHSSYLLIGSVIGLITAFLLSVAFARLLPKEVYGQYGYILSVAGLIAIATLTGMNNAVIQGVAKGFEGVLKKGFIAKLKWGLWGSVASIGMAIYYWLYKENLELAISFLIVAVLLPLFKGGEIYQSYLDGKKLFGKRVTYTALIQIISTILIVATLFLTKNLIAIILVYFSSYGILRMFFLFFVIRKMKPNKTDDPETITYGKHLSYIGIIGIIAQQIDKVLLFNLVGPAQLAIYWFATAPVEYSRTPLQNLIEIALPKLSTKSKEEIKKTLPKKLLKSMIIIGIMTVVYILVAPYIYKIFFPQYMDSVFYSRLYSLSLFIFPMTMMRLSLQAQMMTKELYKINVISPAIQIILFIALTPFFGVLGAVIARLLSYVCYFFLTWFFFKKM
ncbi:MAG: oligosaccharide flippase family protein [Nanoarchaeota archaeon]|nr:oligosaccharide flippase family protein [Nanoarchaeota archaeon]